jgi:hypothetical protein
MNLRLVSNSDSRALLIRDHVLALLRSHGAVQVQRDTVAADRTSNGCVDLSALDAIQ